MELKNLECCTFKPLCYNNNNTVASDKANYIHFKILILQVVLTLNSNPLHFSLLPPLLIYLFLYLESDIFWYLFPYAYPVHKINDLCHKSWSWRVIYLANSEVFLVKTDNSHKCAFMCELRIFLDFVCVSFNCWVSNGKLLLRPLSTCLFDFFCNSDYARMAQGIVSMK